MRETILQMNKIGLSMMMRSLTRFNIQVPAAERM